MSSLFFDEAKRQLCGRPLKVHSTSVHHIKKRKRNGKQRKINTRCAEDPDIAKRPQTDAAQIVSLNELKREK